MKMKHILAFIIFSLVFFQTKAQSDKQLDSLLVSIYSESSDSIKLVRLIDLSRKLNRDIRNLDQCELVLEKALSIASKDSNYLALSKVYNSYGVLYRNIAEYEKALKYHEESLKYAEKVNNLQLISTAYNSIGVVYRRVDNHPKATQFHLLGLNTAESIKDTSNISISLNSLGNIYSLNGQYNEAFSYYKKALEYALAMNNTLGQAINYNNIGEVYEFMGVMDSALVYYSKSLEANKKIKSQKGIAISYNAIGKIYLFKEKANDAYSLFNDALIIDLKLGDKKFIADSHINLGRALIKLNNLNKAEYHANLGLQISREIGSVMHSQWAYEILSEIEIERQNYNRALELYQLATKFKDSLINEKNTRAIAMMEVMFDSDKKEKEIQILKQTQEINQKELARQKVIRNFYLAGFIFAFATVIAVLFALNTKRKANRILAKQKEEIELSNQKLSIQQNEIILQKEEIEKQRNNIEQKNKYLEDAYKVIEGYIGKITDSIRYAERIQKAILPPTSVSKDFFSDVFYLFKPKDFVSGDFYWLTEKDNKLYVAVADCTGHGVPGAFMSIIGMDLLNQAINQQGITEPSKILDFLNIELRNKLRKEDKEELILKDSMDIAVLTYNRGDNKLLYSGALIPLTIVRRKKIIEYKPDFASIGISHSIFSKSFKQQEIEIRSGDWIYMYSDGFIDQFGGDDNKKFMRSRFLNCLQEINIHNADTQKAELERIFIDWKKTGEQIDDILVLGLKV